MAQQGPPIPAALAAGAQLPLPAINAAPPLPRTFAELFASLPDAYGGAYQAFFHDMNPDPALTGAEVRVLITHMFPTDTVPSVWLYQDRLTGQIQTVVIPHTIQGVNGPHNPWVGRTIAFASDILYGQIASIAFPDALCDRADPVRVPTIENMQAELAANGQAVFLGPYADNDPDTEEVITRRTVPVPHVYVPLVLFRSLTPREAWLQLGEAIVMDQRQADCAPLLNFLRAATVFSPLPQAAVAPAGPAGAAAAAAQQAGAPQGGAAQPGAAAAQAAGGVNVPGGAPVTLCPPTMTPNLPDAQLMEHIRRVYLRYLPALGVPDLPHHLTQQLLQSTIVLRDALEGAAVAQQQQAQAQVAAPAENKSFSAVYPGMAQGLRKLCGAGNDDELLPTFWKTFAAAGGKKNQCLPALTTLLNQRALEQDSPKIQQVVVNRLYENLQQFCVGSTDVEDLPLGLSPFIVCPAGYYKASEQRAASYYYTSVHGEGCQATLGDIKVLLPADINVPGSFHQLMEFIGAYSVLLDVLTGRDEPLAVSVRNHFFFWQNSLSEVNASIAHESAAVQTSFMLGVLRAIQLEVLHHINDRMNLELEDVRPPDFTFIVNAIRRRTFRNMPSLPSKYYKDVSRDQQAEAAVAAGLAGPKDGNAAPPAAEKPRVGTNVFATESQATPEWQQRLVDSGKSVQLLKTVGAKALPSSGDRKSKLCLSFHLRGSCFDNCRNKATHRKLTAGEKKDMEVFLAEHL